MGNYLCVERMEKGLPYGRQKGIIKAISKKREKKHMICKKIVIEEKTENYNEAFLQTYFWEESKELYPGQKRPVVLICPGGAYAMTSDREAEAIALRFMSMGYHAAVLRYSVYPAVYPAALRQLSKTVSLLREKSEEWLIEKDKIVVMGFSAGGHLAASLGAFWNEEKLQASFGLKTDQVRPDGLILCYPVITSGEFGHQDSFHNLLGERYEELREKMSIEKQITEAFPKTFIWHTFADTTVLPENSLLFVSAMRRQGVPVEYHLFPDGLHGIGLGNELTANPNGRGIVPACEPWSDLAGKWLEREFPWWNV